MALGSISAIPFEDSLFECVRVGHQQDGYKDQHLAKQEQAIRKYALLRVMDGPRVKEYQFNVENDKQHRDQIEADDVAALGVPYGRHARFIRIELRADRPAGSQQPRANETSGAKCEAEQGENYNSYVCGQVAKTSHFKIDAAADVDILGESPL